MRDTGERLRDNSARYADSAASGLDVKALTWAELAWYAERGNQEARAELQRRPKPQGER